MYVMTPEFGAASQLEKIDMLDFADLVAINKFERRGADDALRDVGRQLVRNREAFGKQPEDMPVFGTSAATFNDDGVTALYQHLRGLLADGGLTARGGHARPRRRTPLSRIRQVVPADRVRYLAEIAETVRGYHAETDELVEPARRVQRARGGPRGARRGGERRRRRAAREGPQAPRPGGRRAARAVAGGRRGVLRRRAGRDDPREGDPHQAHPGVPVRQQDPARLAPRFDDHGELVRFWRRENLPGCFPFTAGVFPFKRDGRGPGADVRRRGRPGPHQPALQGPALPGSRASGCRPRSTR